MPRSAAVIFVLGLFLACAAVAAAAPKIEFEEETFSFGEVYQGAKVEHVFTFRNGGDEPLTIDKVRTSCGCTAALLSATVLQPGEAGELRTSFDSGRFRGEVVKTIYVYANDPLRQVSQLYVRGKVTPEIVVEPAQLELDGLTVGRAQEARVVLTGRGKEAVPLLSVETTAPELQAALSAETLLPGKTAEVVVTVTPREGKARLSGYVLVKTGSSHVPELRIPVYGVVGAP